MKLYIIRHGQSESNIGNYSKEYNIDPKLTDRGLIQAKLLGERLAAIDFDAILSSPLVRSVETATQAAVRQKGNCFIEILPELAETGTPYDFNIDTAKLKSVYGRMKFIPHISDSYDNEQSRAYGVIKYVKARFSHDENILLSCHGTYNTYLLSAAINSKMPENLVISQHNASLNLIEYFDDTNGDSRIRIKYMNDVRHLPYELIT